MILSSAVHMHFITIAHRSPHFLGWFPWRCCGHWLQFLSVRCFLLCIMWSGWSCSGYRPKLQTEPGIWVLVAFIHSLYENILDTDFIECLHRNFCCSLKSMVHRMEQANSFFFIVEVTKFWLKFFALRWFKKIILTNKVMPILNIQMYLHSLKWKTAMSCFIFSKPESHSPELTTSKCFSCSVCICILISKEHASFDFFRL